MHHSFSSLTSKTFLDERFRKEYLSYTQNHTIELEARRHRYFKHFQRNLIIAFALVLTSPYTAIYITKFISELPKMLMLSSKSSHGQEVLIYSSTLIFIFLFAIIFAARPIFRYRGHKVSIFGVTESYISLKERAFSGLFEFFGDFSFHMAQGIPLRDLNAAGVLPEFDYYQAEDRIYGTYNDCHLELSECRFIINDDTGTKRYCTFRGLIAMIDISNMGAHLRKEFEGYTLLLHPAYDGAKIYSPALKGKNNRRGHAKREKFHRVVLPKEFEDDFELYSTNEKYAQNLFGNTVFSCISELSETITDAKMQFTHMDDQILRWWSDFTTATGGILSRLPDTIFRRSRHHSLEKRRIEQYVSKNIPSMYGSRIIDGREVKSINNVVQCCILGDKVIITLPYDKDLFEPNSVFEPALIDEDKDMIYKIMHLIFRLTESMTDHSYR